MGVKVIPCHQELPRLWRSQWDYKVREADAIFPASTFSLCAPAWHRCMGIFPPKSGHMSLGTKAWQHLHQQPQLHLITHSQSVWLPLPWLYWLRGLVPKNWPLARGAWCCCCVDTEFRSLGLSPHSIQPHGPGPVIAPLGLSFIVELLWGLNELCVCSMGKYQVLN